jgi:hypothetical protein
MQRLVVALLAAVDAAIAAAVGLAAILAPATVLWVFGFGGDADWGALWPAAGSVWQLGHLVPLDVTLPAEYLAAAGIDAAAATFVVSLAPLAFTVLTAALAARSGLRASRNEGWGAGVAAGTVVFALAATGIALSARDPVAEASVPLGIVLPVAVFAVPALLAAVVTEWREADVGLIARLRDGFEERTGAAGLAVAAETVRGTAIVVVGLVGAAALLLTVATVLRGPEIIALTQAGNADALGATMLTLAQFAYLPTVVVWALAFIAGPGFALGTGTEVAPAGTQVGVVPPIPLLGLVPESTTPWLLLLALVPVALGVLAGWVARSQLVATSGGADRMGPRLLIALGIGVFSGGVVALLALLASGSAGPGTLAQVGPSPGAVGLAVGLEALAGAAILLVLPRGASADDGRDEGWATDGPDVSEPGAHAWGADPSEWDEERAGPAPTLPAEADASQADTQPLFPRPGPDRGTPLD